MMKKILLVATTLALVVSCSVTKAARESRNTLSGTWTLNNISFENNEGTFKSVIFGDARDICFEGSNWFFRDNNSTGRYTIKAGSLCSGGDRHFRWSVVDRPGATSQLQFKRIDEKYKDISGGVGYRLDIASLTASEMTLKSDVTTDGQPVTIVYQFTKN